MSPNSQRIHRRLHLVVLFTLLGLFSLSLPLTAEAHPGRGPHSHAAKKHKKPAKRAHKAPPKKKNRHATLWRVRHGRRVLVVPPAAVTGDDLLIDDGAVQIVRIERQARGQAIVEVVVIRRSDGTEEELEIEWGEN